MKKAKGDRIENSIDENKRVSRQTDTYINYAWVFFKSCCLYTRKKKLFDDELIGFISLI